MTERRPPACHWDRNRGERVTREHRDDCPDPATHVGCVPCTAPHCVVCSREHTTNDHPQTCPTCIGKVRDDLITIRTAYAALATEALDAGADGRLVAAAPIPGGTAAVLIGPTVRLDLLKVNRHTRKDHAVDRRGRSHDPLPPLAVLAQWEDMWRAWLGHQRGYRRATIGAAIGYLHDQTEHLAQQQAGPDWPAFTRQIRSLRAHLERALHDEREPELGVECFECGDQLVRRFRDPRLCRHETPPRRVLGFWLRLGYPEALTVIDARAARVPCGRCSQGGLDDPTAGLSWECPGCRKDYDPGEYATAVRRDLLDGEHGADGWTHVSMAAEAATMLTQVSFTSEQVRRWMDRGKVASMCRWRCDQAKDGTLAPVPWGLRLVLWDDVKERAVDAVARARILEQERRREVEQERSLRAAVDDGEDVDVAGRRLVIHPARVEKFLAKWAAEARLAARRERLGA